MGMYVKGAAWEIIGTIECGRVKYVGKLAPLTAGGFAPKVEFDTGNRVSSGSVDTADLSPMVAPKSDLAKLIAQTEAAAKAKTEAAPAAPAAAGPVFMNLPTAAPTTTVVPDTVPIGTDLTAADGTVWKVTAVGTAELQPQ